MHYEQREAEIYDRVYASIRADIPFWQTLALEYAGHGGRALELACGTLRVTLPVAEAGVNVTGLDESPHMLALAYAKLDAAPPDIRARVTLLEGDMRELRLGQKFNLVYIPFNTFGLLLTPADQLHALQVIKQHLAPDGVFAFDVFMPDVEKLAPANLNRWMLEADESFPDGTRIQRESVREVDTRRQIVSVLWRHKEFRDRILEREWVSDLQLTYFFPRELEHLLARAGYEIVQYWGDYARTPFWEMSEPPKQLVVARPA